jgi:hypothetical protein
VLTELCRLLYLVIYKSIFLNYLTKPTKIYRYSQYGGQNPKVVNSFWSVRGEICMNVYLCEQTVRLCWLNCKLSDYVGWTAYFLV